MCKVCDAIEEILAERFERVYQLGKIDGVKQGHMDVDHAIGYLRRKNDEAIELLTKNTEMKIAVLEKENARLRELLEQQI